MELKVSVRSGGQARSPSRGGRRAPDRRAHVLLEARWSRQDDPSMPGAANLRSRGEPGETLVVMPASGTINSAPGPRTEAATASAVPTPWAGTWSAKAGRLSCRLRRPCVGRLVRSRRIPQRHARSSSSTRSASRTPSSPVRSSGSNGHGAWALTGTPLKNRLDAVSQSSSLPHRGRFDPAGKAVGLRKLLAEVQLRRRRRDVLPDFPPKLVSTVHLTLGRRQEATHPAGKARGACAVGSAWPGRAHHARARTDPETEADLQFLPRKRELVKLADLRHLGWAVAAASEKALVFSQLRLANLSGRAEFRASRPSTASWRHGCKHARGRLGGVRVHLCRCCRCGAVGWG